MRKDPKNERETQANHIKMRNIRVCWFDCCQKLVSLSSFFVFFFFDKQSAINRTNLHFSNRKTGKNDGKTQNLQQNIKFSPKTRSSPSVDGDEYKKKEKRNKKRVFCGKEMKKMFSQQRFATIWTRGHKSRGTTGTRRRFFFSAFAKPLANNEENCLGMENAVLSEGFSWGFRAKHAHWRRGKCYEHRCEWLQRCLGRGVARTQTRSARRSFYHHSQGPKLRGFCSQTLCCRVKQAIAARWMQKCKSPAVSCSPSLYCRDPGFA